MAAKKAIGKVSSTKKVLVTQIKSAIGRDGHTTKQLKALGLGRIGSKTTFTLNPSLSGAIAKLQYLLKVEEIKAQEVKVQ